MSEQDSMNPRPVLIATLAALLLSGCMSTPPRWQAATLTTVTEAAPTELVMQGKGALGKAERRQLADFQRDHRASAGDRLLLSYAPARRDAAVAAAEWLSDRGLAAALRADPLLPNGNIHLGLWRTRMTVPECGTWQGANHSDFNNQPWPDFGCATTRNLGLMVADPADLVSPGALGPGSGEEAAGAIERHRSFHDESSGGGSPISINLGGESGGSE